MMPRRQYTTVQMSSTATTFQHHTKARSNGVSDGNAQLRQHVARGTGEWSAVPECVREAIAELLVRSPALAQDARHPQTVSATKHISPIRKSTVAVTSSHAVKGSRTTSIARHKDPSPNHAVNMSTQRASRGADVPRTHLHASMIAPLQHLSDDALLMTVRSFEDAEALRLHAVRNSALFHNNIEQLFRDMRLCLVPELRAAIQLHPDALSELKRQNVSGAGRYGAEEHFGAAPHLPSRVRSRIAFEDALLSDVVDAMHKLRAASVRFTANFFNDDEKISFGIDPNVLPKEDEHASAATTTTCVEPLDRNTLLVDSAFRRPPSTSAADRYHRAGEGNRNNGREGGYAQQHVRVDHIGTSLSDGNLFRTVSAATTAFEELRYDDDRHRHSTDRHNHQRRWLDATGTPPGSANQSYDASMPSLYPDEGDAGVPEDAERPEDRSPRRMGRHHDDHDVYEVDGADVGNDGHINALAEEEELPGDRSPRRYRDVHDNDEATEDVRHGIPNYYTHDDHSHHPTSTQGDVGHRMNPLEAQHYEDPFDPPQHFYGYQTSSSAFASAQQRAVGSASDHQPGSQSGSGGRTRGLMNFLNRSTEDESEPHLSRSAQQHHQRHHHHGAHESDVTPSRVLNMDAAVQGGGGGGPTMGNSSGGDSMYPPPPPLTSSSPMDRRRYLPPTSPPMVAVAAQPLDGGLEGGGAAARSPHLVVDISPRSFGRSPSPDEDRSNTPFHVALPSTPRTRNDYVVYPSPRPISVKKMTVLVPRSGSMDRSSSAGVGQGASPPRSPSNSMRRSSAHQRRASQISSLDASLSASTEVSPRHRAVAFAPMGNHAEASPAGGNTTSAGNNSMMNNSSFITYQGQGRGEVRAVTGRSGVHW